MHILQKYTVLVFTKTIGAWLSGDRKVCFDVKGSKNRLIITLLTLETHVIIRVQCIGLTIWGNPSVKQKFEHSLPGDALLTGEKLYKMT